MASGYVAHNVSSRVSASASPLAPACWIRQRSRTTRMRISLLRISRRWASRSSSAQLMVSGVLTKSPYCASSRGAARVNSSRYSGSYSRSGPQGHSVEIGSDRNISILLSSVRQVVFWFENHARHRVVVHGFTRPCGPTQLVRTTGNSRRGGVGL